MWMPGFYSRPFYPPNSPRIWKRRMMERHSVLLRSARETKKRERNEIVVCDRQTNHQSHPWTCRTKGLGTQTIHAQGLLENRLSYIYTRTTCRFSTNINTNLNLEYPELLAKLKWRTFHPLTRLWEVTNANINQSHFHWTLTRCNGDYVLQLLYCASPTSLSLQHKRMFVLSCT